MKPLATLITGCLLVITLAFSIAPASAQRSRWTTPFEISPPVPADTSVQITPTPLPPGQKEVRYGSSWFPSMAIGPTGSVHIVWYSGIATTAGNEGSIDLLMYRELRDGVWSPFNDVVQTTTGGYTVRNSIVMSRDGKLHVLLRMRTVIRHVSAPWDRAWSAAAWSEPHPVSDGGYYVALGVDSRARLHAFWSGGLPDAPGVLRPECPNCANLYYRYSDTSGVTWSEPINLSNSKYGDNRPQVKVDNRDRVHVVWDQGKDWYVGLGKPKQGVYRRSDDRGETWRPPVYFTVPDDAVQQTTIGIAAGDNPIVVYRTLKGAIYYQYSRDGGDTWSLPDVLPGIVARDTIGNDLDQYSMATDGEGNVHLLVVGYPTTMSGIVPGAVPSMVLHLVWNGSRWSSPEIVSANEFYPEWPVLAVSNGNRLHAVWYTRKADGRSLDERDRYRVWYSSRLLSISETTPLPLFTAVPTAIPTNTPEPTTSPPTPTALPVDVVQSPAISGPPTWEIAALPVLVIALVPTVGVVVSLVILSQRRR